MDWNTAAAHYENLLPAVLDVQRYAAELGDPRLLQPPVPAGWLRFSHWRPDLAHFPFAIWHRLMNRHLGSTAGALFDYADSSAGYDPLRREIAAYLARTRAVTCSPDQVLIVNGSQQGLDLCTRVLIDRGDEVALENDLKFLKAQMLEGDLSRKAQATENWGAITPANIADLQAFLNKSGDVQGTVDPGKMIVSIPGFFDKVNDFDKKAIEEDAKQCKL